MSKSSFLSDGAQGSASIRIGRSDRRLQFISRHLSTEPTSASSIERSKVCVIVGAGDATGTALARKFHREGFAVACVRRNGDKLDDGIVKELGAGCRGFGVDARKEEDITALFRQVEAEMGPVEVCIHNIGGNVRFPLMETTERVYRKVWELCALSAFLVGREAVKHMLPRKRGTMIFTGATASTRGAANFAAFSGGMSAKRALAQSMAREFAPQGIHVVHVVIDGPIETKFIRDIFGEEKFKEMKANAQLLDPSHIADAYYNLHTQQKTAWTFELDLRPYSEIF